MFSLFNIVGLYSTAHTQMMRCKIIALGRRSLLFQMVFATAMLLQLFLPFSCLELIVVVGALQHHLKICIIIIMKIVNLYKYFLLRYNLFLQTIILYKIQFYNTNYYKFTQGPLDIGLKRQYVLSIKKEINVLPSSTLKDKESNVHFFVLDALIAIF